MKRNTNNTFFLKLPWLLSCGREWSLYLFLIIILILLPFLNSCSFPSFSLSPSTLFAIPFLPLPNYQVSSYCKDHQLLIGGYYQANKFFHDSAPDHFSQKVAEKINESNPNSFLLMVSWHSQNWISDPTIKWFPSILVIDFFKLIQRESWIWIEEWNKGTAWNNCITLFLFCSWMNKCLIWL